MTLSYDVLFDYSTMTSVRLTPEQQQWVRDHDLGKHVYRVVIEDNGPDGLRVAADRYRENAEGRRFAVDGALQTERVTAFLRYPYPR
jgi:hypothetical protein